MGVSTALVLLVLVEGVLRLFGFPVGTFNGAFRTVQGLYPPNYSEELTFGPIRYRVEANSHGFRGPELRTGLAAAEVRIVAIGDSATDGFYVDNEATYPYLLEHSLVQAGHDVEVINAARGGASIDQFLAVLRDTVVPLAPEVVVITFVTNDIAEIAGRGLPELLSLGLDPTLKESMAGIIATRTAIGEGLLDLYLRLRSDKYRRHERQVGAANLDDDRYEIDGGDRYEENARLFLKTFERTDGMLLGEELHPVVRGWIENYFEVLARFRDTCRENGIELLFVYFPAYSQVYLPDAPTTSKDFMTRRVEELGIPLLDLTKALRDGSVDGPLHLAPIDWHLNPRGNKVIAEAIAAMLIEQGWIKP